jgi:hypothetical protein
MNSFLWVAYILQLNLLDPVQNIFQLFAVDGNQFRDEADQANLKSHDQAYSGEYQAMNALIFLYRRFLKTPLDKEIDAVRSRKKILQGWQGLGGSFACYSCSHAPGFQILDPYTEYLKIRLSQLKTQIQTNPHETHENTRKKMYSFRVFRVFRGDWFGLSF